MHDWDDPIRDDEFPDEADTVDGDNPALVPCPACGELMADDAPQCAACGDWVTAWSPATERAHGWLWPMIVALLVGVILVIWNKLGQ